METVTVRVRPGSNITHRGRLHGPGETLELPATAAASWARQGSVEAIDAEPEAPTPAPKRSARKP